METSQRNKSKSIVITLDYKDNKYQFSTELAKPIETFYNEVCSYLQLNPKYYLLYYNSTQISFKSNQNKILSDIVNTSNTNSLFKIVPKIKENKILNANNLNDDNICAIITKYPSVKEVEKILEDFNMNNIHNKNKKGAIINLGNNTLKVVFNNEAYLNEFINYISFIKYENPHYKTITIKKDVSNLKLKKKGMSNLVLPNLEGNFDNKYNYSNNNNLSKSVSKPAKLKLNIKIDDVIKALKHNELNKDTYHGLSLNRDGEDEIITDYYQQQSFLRNSSPYITEHEKHVLEEKENKKHFFKNKEFFTSVGKYSMKQNFIPNYVGLTPGENPKNHEFREVDKNKWINKKGFNI